MGELSLTKHECEAAARKIRTHYRLRRKVTRVEVMAEFSMLIRRGLGNLDDSQERLAAALQTGDFPVIL